MPLIDPAISQVFTVEIHDLSEEEETTTKNEERGTSLKFLEQPYRLNKVEKTENSGQKVEKAKKSVENRESLSTRTTEENSASVAVGKPYVPPLDLSILHEHGSGSGK